MPVVFDNVIGSVVDDTTPSPSTDSPPPPMAETVPLSTQLRKLDQRTRRLNAN
jgi:hypothetical protein